MGPLVPENYYPEEEDEDEGIPLLSLYPHHQPRLGESSRMATMQNIEEVEQPKTDLKDALDYDEKHQSLDKEEDVKVHIDDGEQLHDTDA